MGKVRTVPITFNCAEAGTVVWNAPRELFMLNMSNSQISREVGHDFLAPVGKLFALLYATMKVGDKRLMDKAISDADQSLQFLSRRTAREISSLLQEIERQQRG